MCAFQCSVCGNRNGFFSVLIRKRSEQIIKKKTQYNDAVLFWVHNPWRMCLRRYWRRTGNYNNKYLLCYEEKLIFLLQILTPRELDWQLSSHVEYVACGQTHTLMLTKEGAVYSCGNNDFSQLGHDQPRKRPRMSKFCM